MTYAGGPGGPGTHQRWPVAGGQQPLRHSGPRADPVAFLLLLIAGACGLAQYLVSGYPVGQSFAGAGTVVTGEELLPVLVTLGTPTANVTRIALLVTTVGGGALILLAISTLLPINHRPLGGVALMFALAGIATSAWLLAQAATVLGSPATDLLSGDQLGWYLTAAFSVIGIAGSFKALGG